MQGYIVQATGRILNRLGLSTLPDEGSNARLVAQAVCLELVMVAIDRVLHGMNENAARALGDRERAAIDSLGEVAKRRAGKRPRVVTWGGT